MLNFKKEVKEKYPNLFFGIMIMDKVSNPSSNLELNKVKRMLEQNIRDEYSGMDKKLLKTMFPLSKYNDFYKKFKKTYHVQHQLISIANKKRNLPDKAALVESMFMAEVKNLILTAGFDLRKISGSLSLSLSDGETSYSGIGEQIKTPPKGDVVLKEDDTIIGSIIGGPDHQRQITKETDKVLFAIFGVPGITKDHIENHLIDIKEYVSIVSPDSTIEYMKVF